MALNKIKVNNTTTINTGVVYDITKATGQSYTDLKAALGTDGNNVPPEVREGGMSIRFVSNSNNKYVQYRLIAQSFSTNVFDWEKSDDEPIAIQNTTDISELTLLTPGSTQDGYFMQDSGTPKANDNFSIWKYTVTPGKAYTFSGEFGDLTTIHFIGWFDENDILLSWEPYGGSNAKVVDKAIVAQSGAAYAVLNVATSGGHLVHFNFKSVGESIKSRDLQKELALSNTRAGLSPGRISNRILLTPDSTTEGKFINSKGTEGTNASFSYKIYEIDSSKLYCFSGRLSNAGIPFIVWFDNNHNFISHEYPIGSDIDGKKWEFQLAYPPKYAHYAYMNIQNVYSNYFAFYEMSLLDVYNDALVSKQVLPSGNLNDYKQNGFYLLTDSSIYQNVPNNNSVGFLRIENTGSGWGIQEYWNLNGSEYYIRRWNRGGFIDWTSVGDLTEVNTKLNYQGNKIYEILVALSNKEILINISKISGKYISSNGEIKENHSFNYRIFLVTPGDNLLCRVKTSETVNIWVFNWYDSNYNYISQNELSGSSFDGYKSAIVPNNASYVYINEYGSYPITLYKLTNIISQNISLVDEIPSIIKAVSDEIELTPSSTTTGKYINSTGIEGTHASFSYKTYPVIGGNFYLFSGIFSNAGINYFHWYDENNNWIVGTDEKGPNTQYIKKIIKAPDNAAYAKQNIQNCYIDYFDFSEITNKISSKELKEKIKALEDKAGLTKIVINSLEEPVSTIWGNSIAVDRFHIRSKYNSEKDILIRHYYNGNGLVSFLDTYIGPKDLTDDELVTEQYLMSSHSDSTAPFFKVTEYWHLFAQHGYPIPHISNPGLTNSDIGAKWKDQLDREYTIGRVTSSYVYLLPTIYQVDGHDVRDWKNTAYSTAITSLVHISGGTYTDSITVSGYGQDQLRPIMSVSNRKFILDGVELIQPGEYYGNEFKVSESAIGYDPASITDWFGNTGDNVDPVGSSPMAEFTFSYNYYGAQCCVNTTVHMLKELQCERYGAIQQQFFYDKDNYKAMFMLPKAAPQSHGGIITELDKPFNSSNSQSWGPDIHRNSTQLKDVDNPVDRQIGFLYNPNTDDYLIGMAAGLSLINGDTITSKRIQNCEIGSDQYHTLLGFSPGNINKMYIAAINTGKYQDHFFPVGLFKEINYYVSYFDPAENIGQVYWYKDGNKFIIYCHCQTVELVLPINVPSFMEGLKLSVVEKTDDTELLTDTIQNGKFFVNYNSNEANHIVLIAE